MGTAVKAALAAAGAPAPTTVAAPAVVTPSTTDSTLSAAPRALPGLGTQLMAAFVTVLATVMFVQHSWSCTHVHVGTFVLVQFTSISKHGKAKGVSFVKLQRK